MLMKGLQILPHICSLVSRFPFFLISILLFYIQDLGKLYCQSYGFSSSHVWM